jgi:hypothetical protein
LAKADDGRPLRVAQSGGTQHFDRTAPPTVGVKQLYRRVVGLQSLLGFMAKPLLAEFGRDLRHPIVLVGRLASPFKFAQPGVQCFHRTVCRFIRP